MLFSYKFGPLQIWQKLIRGFNWDLTPISPTKKDRRSDLLACRLKSAAICGRQSHCHINHQPLHEPGKYLAGIGLVAEGPHFHIAIVPPPAVAGAKAVVPAASEYGVRVIEFAVPLVDPPRFAALATTMISPAVPTDPEVTYFVAVKVHGAAASGATILGVVDD